MMLLIGQSYQFHVFLPEWAGLGRSRRSQEGGTKMEAEELKRELKIKP